MFEEFTAYYGNPQPATATTLASVGLQSSSGLAQFAAEVGCGIFTEGLLSVVSVRECVNDLGGWQHWLPPTPRLFACSAFGFLMVTTTGDNVWIVNTQYGEILETELSITEAIIQCAAQTTREDILRSRIFDLWRQMSEPLPPDSVLSPTPAIALGGTWTATTLSVMTLPVYLSFTAQMFGPDSATPANVHRLADE